jgi:large subunit ribosomal protein L4
VVLFDVPAFDAPKTAVLRDYFGGIELGGKKVLVLTDGVNENLYLSGRNLPEVEVKPFGEEHPYEILWADVVVIERSAMDALGSNDAEAEDEGDDDA